MKIIIGTPIHQVKDYSMERWIQNVSKIQKKSPSDLLMVDNSPNLDYVEKVKGYCKKYGIKNYQIKHLDFNQGMSVDEKDQRIEASEEIIRQEVLSKDYDAWFSWECDQIIPTNTLSKLIRIMNAGDFMMVVHNSWDRRNSTAFNPDMGITLIKRDCLEKYGSLLKRGSTPWQGGNRWYKERVARSGGNYIDVYGAVNPIYHLDR